MPRRLRLQMPVHIDNGSRRCGCIRRSPSASRTGVRRRIPGRSCCSGRGSFRRPEWTRPASSWSDGRNSCSGRHNPNFCAAGRNGEICSSCTGRRVRGIPATGGYRGRTGPYPPPLRGRRDGHGAHWAYTFSGCFSRPGIYSRTSSYAIGHFSWIVLSAVNAINPSASVNGISRRRAPDKSRA